MIFLKLKTFIQKNSTRKIIKYIYMSLSIIPALFILSAIVWEVVDSIQDSIEESARYQQESPTTDSAEEYSAEDVADNNVEEKDQEDQNFELIDSAISEDHLFKAEIRKYYSSEYYNVFVTNLNTDIEHRVYSDDHKLTDTVWTEDGRVQISRICEHYCIYFKVIGDDELVNQKIPWEARSDLSALTKDDASKDGRYLLSERMEGSDPFRYRRMYVTDLQSGAKWQVYGGDERGVSAYWLPDNRVAFIYGCGSDCLTAKKIDIDQITFVSNEPGEEMNRDNGWQIRYLRPSNEDPEHCIPFVEDMSKWECNY